MLIRFFAGVRSVTGVQQIEWEEPADTLGELLHRLADRYGPEFHRWVLDDEALGGAVMVVVNGDDVRPRAGLRTRLAPTDVISILPVMAGGCAAGPHRLWSGCVVPFDAGKLTRLMADAGLDLLLACSRHNVRYLTGGYYYHFHSRGQRMGLSQYLPFVGLPAAGPAEAFFVCRPEERPQVEAAVPWIARLVEALRGTVSAAGAAAETVQCLGIDGGRIGVELPFLPADAYLELRRRLPVATFVDATPVLEELRAVKTAAELALLRDLYARLAEAIAAGFRAGAAGITTREIARQVEREIVGRGMGFLYALVCAGPGTLRAPAAVPWEPGRILHIDAGAEGEDYLADICRMGCRGEPSPLARDLHAQCLAIQGAARARVRAGTPCREVLLAGEDALRASPFARHGRFVVHGIGMVSHEQPRITPNAERPLEAGMVLSVETDFIHPEVGHVKIEDAVAVTVTGCEGLGDAGRDWHVVRP
jgi:MoaD family protein